MDFKDKVVVITGAGSGIGQALAFNLAKEGSCLAVADINKQALAKTVEALSTCNCKVTAHVVDVARRDQVSRFAAEVIEQHGKVDIVVNNAGVALMESIDDVKYDDLEWIVNINFWGVVYGTKAFLPYLKERPEAYIVNMSSIAGLAGLPVQAAYSATKFAIRGFTEAIRLELANTPIRVFCVHPGGVKTDIVRNARYYKNPDKLDELPNQMAGAERFDTHFAITTADEAAKKIIKCMRTKTNKSRILIGWDARFVDWVSRFFPNLYPKAIEVFGKYSSHRK
ncbi:SDR family NAD(P)-dependent oxidoreductase [Methylocaldum gracile]|jgi:butyryl-CoA dehydrogenase|uniref:SDR family NAD(P)-dependent oxidoreductase n=1 Tax=unclassified Methylocaldum TaxID=2622260 RepID=UPI001061D1A2